MLRWPWVYPGSRSSATASLSAGSSVVAEGLEVDSVAVLVQGLDALGLGAVERVGEGAGGIGLVAQVLQQARRDDAAEDEVPLGEIFV